jgi:hypothetical protein
MRICVTQVEYCQECLEYPTGRDEIGSYCHEGVDLSKAV